MFWKKKQVVAVGAESSSAVSATKTPAGEKAKLEKLPGPKEMPAVVQKHLVDKEKLDADLVRLLKAVVRKSAKGERAFDIRVFDEAEAVVKKITVKDYNSLDEHPVLTIYEGWFDEESKRVELEEKKKFHHDVSLLAEAEIRQKIEALGEPGSTVFFYQARGPMSGGPLGRGAAVVELNPGYPAKGQRKYIIYTADVDGLEPVGNGEKLFTSDKPKEIATWVKEAHHKRCY